MKDHDGCAVDIEWDDDGQTAFITSSDKEAMTLTYHEVSMLYGLLRARQREQHFGNSPVGQGES